MAVSQMVKIQNLRAKNVDTNLKLAHHGRLA